MILKLKRLDKIGLFFFLAFIVSMSLIWLFEERFSTEQWLENPAQRYKMVDDLIESQILIGKTKDEVAGVLGQPNLRSPEERDAFAYSIGEHPSFFESKREMLVITFVNQKVDEVTLATE
ncbi:hypothetical protein [Winogradskyella flava]|uniref:SmpA / OmlA family protein n=1 Tax=Winogradskyella flava TaxID=1884876 RepID=A0A842IS95_9FLAO|nr:hypothetical protein [Winogradskyella flava]MBC2844307.1 hypothetical protein [Winogradskyella flava]